MEWVRRQQQGDRARGSGYKDDWPRHTRDLVFWVWQCWQLTSLGSPAWRWLNNSKGNRTNFVTYRMMYILAWTLSKKREKE